jgi:hypothetical protein
MEGSSLPAATIAARILKYTGLTVIDATAKGEDFLVSITINGKVISAN